MSCRKENPKKSYGNRAHNTEMLTKHELYFSPDESIYSSWSDEDIVQ